MPELPQWPNVAVSHRGGVTELRFHTDDGPLVWSADAHRDLTDAFRWVGTDRATKVVLLTGSGDTFCAEIDVRGFAEMDWDELWWEGRRMLTGLDDIDVPVVSVVNGPATIHSEIPVMGDIVLAADHALFADRAHFAVRNTVPGDGVNIIWGELLGPTRSKYFLLTGEAITASEAHRLGVVNEVLPLSELHDRAWKLCNDLAARSLPVLRYTKAAITIGFRRGLQENISHGLGVQGAGHWSRGGVQGTRYSTEIPDS
ncbi:Enoyl-CoA hydratase [Rhodococcus wratislaviensis]|uniref:Enoyl-CoA hydratase n=1 Tax=Rhodococcus wratislaviensis TaxID=44752 RepID=A0A402CM03_RHOWR|nr:enoyl-CoA hydratase/isomerase family protein [Rhodococcus wratislaviensis]GCE44611.1 Enoyl-CoA hydratase [Rhodococcus wratislaviensis]